jgi:7-cyano-7-deazaguanine synthase
MKILISLSGGMDSATLLGHLLDDIQDEVKAVSFIYGSKHNRFEMEAADQIAKFYNIDHYFLDLTAIFNEIKSNLMLGQGEIPEGHYNDSTMSKTVVPGRNHIFASILAGIAESIGFNRVALGVHAGDHAIYPDCRKNFIECLNRSILLQSENKVSVIAPFIDMTKADILDIGHQCRTPVPYHLTRTCYKFQSKACGKCGSCVERLEAWEKIGKKDPVEYEI